MDEDFVNQGSKLQKLDYSQLVFLQINRLGFLTTNFYSGDLKYADYNFKYFEKNRRMGLAFLESMILYQLNEKDKAQFIEDKKSAHTSDYWFDLLMSYLPKANIMPAKRKALETLSES